MTKWPHCHSRRWNNLLPNIGNLPCRYGQFSLNLYCEYNVIWTVEIFLTPSSILTRLVRFHDSLEMLDRKANHHYPFHLTGKCFTDFNALTSSANMKKKLMTCSGFPSNFFLSTGSCNTSSTCSSPMQLANYIKNRKRGQSDGMGNNFWVPVLLVLLLEGNTLACYTGY